MHAKYDSKKFVIIAINLDTTKADAHKFLNKVPANFTVAYDTDGEVASKYKLKVMPSSYLIDTTGALVYSHKGYRESDVISIEDKIQKHLN